jgi:hypothetical protein
MLALAFGELGDNAEMCGAFGLFWLGELGLPFEHADVSPMPSTRMLAANVFRTEVMSAPALKLPHQRGVQDARCKTPTT